MEGIYLLLGSNIGDRKLNLLNALKKLAEVNVTVIQQSSVYQTAAWGVQEQQAFLNQVIKVETVLKPQQLLKTILTIEQELGRVRIEKWGERLIDIDILYYYDLVLNDTSLKIPHPELQNRRFTLVPLVEISPEMQHPILNCSQSQLLKKCKDKLAVHLFTE